MDKPDYQTDHRHAGGEPCEPEGAFGETEGGGTPVGDVDFADPRADWSGTGQRPDVDHDQRDDRPVDQRGHDDGRAPHDSSPGARSTSAETRKDREPPADDWGFSKENRGMSTETKIGLTLVVLLLGTFGFVVWKKLQQRQADIVASRFDEHPEAKKKPTPKPEPTPKKKPASPHERHDEKVVHADAFDDFERFEKPKPRETHRRVEQKPDGAGWAEIQPVSRESDDPFAELNPDNFRGDAGGGHGRRHDDFATRDEFAPNGGHHQVHRPKTADPAFEDLFADRDDPACEMKPKPAEQRDGGFAEYEFADDFDFGQPRGQKPVDACETGRPGWDQEPGRLEIAEFHEPRIQQTQGTVPAEECPPTRGGKTTADGWADSDFEPIQRRSGRGRTDVAQREPAQRGAGGGWDDFETFEPIDARQNPTRDRQPRGDFGRDDFGRDDFGRDDVSQDRTHRHQYHVDQRPVDARQGDFGRDGFDPAPVDQRTAHHQPHIDPLDGSRVDVEACEAGAPTGTTVHVVEAGDSYWTISRERYASAKYFSALAKFNEYRIANPKHMRPGMKVLCPPAAHLHQRYPKLCGPGEQTAQACEANASGFFVGNDGQPKYRVGEEDTLSDIAHAHLGRGSRWVQIYELNRSRIGKPDTLRVGTVLDLPGDASSVRLVQGARNYR